MDANKSKRKAGELERISAVTNATLGQHKLSRNGMFLV